MLKRVIQYEDFDGETQTEVFWFNMSKSELAEMEVVTEGGMTNFLKRLLETDDKIQIMKIFRELIGKSYGVRSDDGKRFFKSEDLSREFMATAAADELIYQLMSDPTGAAEFFKGVVPRAMGEKMPADLTDTSAFEKIVQETIDAELSEPTNPRPDLDAVENAEFNGPSLEEIQQTPTPQQKRMVTQADLLTMSNKDMLVVMEGIKSGRIELAPTV